MAPGGPLPTGPPGGQSQLGSTAAPEDKGPGREGQWGQFEVTWGWRRPEWQGPCWERAVLSRGEGVCLEGARGSSCAAGHSAACGWPRGGLGRVLTNPVHTGRACVWRPGRDSPPACNICVKRVQLLACQPHRNYVA